MWMSPSNLWWTTRWANAVSELFVTDTFTYDPALIQSIQYNILNAGFTSAGWTPPGTARRVERFAPCLR